MPTERESHSFASHYKFPYYFSDNDNAAPDGGDKQGINFSQIWHFTKDLVIYYGSRDKEGNNYIEGWCSRWDIDNYNIIVETWLKKEDLQTLKNHIRPGAVKELKRVIYSPKFYDSTWGGHNTLLLVPNIYSKWNVFVGYDENEKINPPSKLKEMRSEKTVFVKNITEHTINGNDEFIEIKLEAAISGGVL